MRTPTTVADLLDHLARAGGSPRLTWYGGEGERVELSGAVLANWVTKTTNLLVEELDLGPSGRLRLDLPTHWRSVVWALAAWRTGACVLTRPGGPAADVVVTDRPGEHPDAAALVAVALPALARRFDGDLPAGTIDAAGAVMTYGDVLGWAPTPVPTDPALDDGTTVLTHADLLAGATAGDAPGGASAPAGQRVLLLEGRAGAEDLAATLRTALTILAADGSVVLLNGAAADGLEAAPGARDRLVQTERVTLVR